MPKKEKLVYASQSKQLEVLRKKVAKKMRPINDEDAIKAQRKKESRNAYIFSR